MEYVLKRGDIVWTNFDPSAVHEQALKRPALILSPEPFNKQIQQVKTIDFEARGIAFIEKAPVAVVNEVLAKVRVLIS